MPFLRVCPVYVDVVQVAAASQREEGQHVRALRIGENPRQREGVIRGEIEAADRVEVHRKVDVGCERLLRGGFKIEYADVRIYRAGRANDVGVQLARIPADAAVFHVEPAVE